MIILSKYYYYLICIIFSSLLSYCISGLNHNESFKTVNIAGESFSKHHFIHRLFSYFLIIFCGICLHIYEEESSKSEKEEEGTSKLNKKDTLVGGDYKNDYINKKFILIFILMIFCWIILDDVIQQYVIIFQDLDFWMFELMFLTILNSKIYKVQIFKHQIFAIILSLFSSILKIGSIYISFIDNDDNYKGNLPIYYEKNLPAISITFGIHVYFLLIFLRAYLNLKLKWYMNKKFFSPNKLIIYFGSMGTIIYLIICIISNLFQCKESFPPSNNNNIDFKNYICRVNKTNYINNNYTHYYLENFSIYFDKYINAKEIMREILVILLCFISFFGKQYSSILVISNLTPAHVIFSIPIVFFFQKIVLTSYTTIEVGHIFADSNNKNKTNKFLLDLLGDILSIVGFLIYLEIIILSLCKYDYNIKSNIISRSYTELKEGIEDKDEKDYEIVLEDENYITIKSNEDCTN